MNGRMWSLQELRDGSAGAVLTVPDVAATLRISEWQAYALIRRGALPAVHPGARATRVPVDALLAYVQVAA